MNQHILWEGNVRSLGLRERIAVAHRLGCSKMSLSPNTLAEWEVQGLTLDAVLDLCGEVKLAHLDPLVRWTRGYRNENLSEQLREFSTTSRSEFFECAEGLGVESITLPAIVNAQDTSLEEMAEDFADVCDQADSLGIRCDLEFLPYWSGVPDMETAISVVELAGRPNGSVLFDVYHFMRAGGSPADILSVSGSLISAVQISDGLAELPPGADAVDDMLNARRLPGKGSFPLAEIIANLDEIGAGKVIGLEVFSTELDAYSTDELVDALSVAAHEYLPIQNKGLNQ